MAYDERLAERIRHALGPRDDTTERKMFGGIAFLHHGNMFAGIAKGALMLRVGPEAWESSLALKHARVMDFTGRPMRGYIYVDPPGFANQAKLGRWLERALLFVETLPPKTAKKAKAKTAKRGNKGKVVR